MEMKTHVHYLIGLVAIAFAGIEVSAAEITDSTEVYFRQGRAILDSTFMGNGTRLAQEDSLLSGDKRMRLKSIRVIGSASPEGSVAINRSLSERRAEAIIGYFPELPDSVAEFDYIGRDWAGLARMVEADAQVPARKEVMSLLDEICNSISAGEPDTEENLARLKSVSHEAYAYMYSRMFPALRFSRLFVDYEPQLRGGVVPAVASAPAPEVFFSAPELTLTPVRVDDRKPFYMAVKTNMLYDLLAVPNLGVEFYAGRNWSVTADWAYAWFDKDRTHHYWRYYGGTLGVRRWFGAAAARKPLTGHHVGVYGGAFTYDFELGGKGYMGGKPGGSLFDRCMVNAGVEYGYSLPISRRLNLDFTLGIGYAGGKQVEYIPEAGKYVWQKTKKINWFGPTKAEISLVWLIGHGNVNKAKGGRR